MMALFDRFRNPAAAVAAGTAQGLMEGAGELALNIRTAITGEAPIDGDARAALAVQAQQIEADILLAQAKIGELQAQSTSKVVSWWRPALGWTCVIGIAIEFIARPLADWIASMLGATITTPVMDTGQLIALVVSMLGIAAYRTVEKANGTVGVH